MKNYTEQSTGETFRAAFLGTLIWQDYEVSAHYGIDFFRIAIVREDEQVARFYLSLKDERPLATQLLLQLHRWCLPISIGDTISSLIDG